MTSSPRSVPSNSQVRIETGNVSSTPSPSSSQEEVFLSNLHTVPPDVVRAVSMCREGREQELHLLAQVDGNELFISDIRGLEAGIEQLKDPFPAFQIATYQGQKNGGSSGVGSENEQRGKLQEHLEKSVEELCAKFGLDKEDFNFLFVPESSLSNFECCREIIMGKAFNSSNYERQVRAFMRGNKDLICSAFAHQGVQIPGKIQYASPTDLEIIIKPTLDGCATTHNRGKAPLFITFRVGGESFTLVFKPRDAQIDCAVFATFEAINKLRQGVQLPLCAVINPHLQGTWNGCKQIGAVSLWQCMEGNQISQTKVGNMWEYIGERKKLVSLLKSLHRSIEGNQIENANSLLFQIKNQISTLTFDYFAGKLVAIEKQLNLHKKSVELEEVVRPQFQSNTSGREGLILALEQPKEESSNDSTETPHQSLGSQLGFDMSKLTGIDLSPPQSTEESSSDSTETPHQSLGSQLGFDMSKLTGIDLSPQQSTEESSDDSTGMPTQPLSLQLDFGGVEGIPLPSLELGLSPLLPQVEELIDTLTQENISLEKQAIHLDSILTPMGIGDLIPQNFIIARIDERLYLVPIDLEVVYALETLIGVPKKEHLTLTSEQQGCIGSFHESLQGMPVRILPLATEQMASYAVHSSYHSRERLSRQIMKALEKDYELTIPLDKLQELVLVDLLNRDVPYCTRVKGMLFYGPPSRGIQIGTERRDK